MNRSGQIKKRRPFRLTALVPREHDEQRTVIDWANWASHQTPELRLLFAIPNGGWLVGGDVKEISIPFKDEEGEIPFRDEEGETKSLRFKIAAKLKAEGLKVGVPDLCWPIARGGYHGLFIEMKRREGGVPSKEQKWWIDHLAEQGYLARVCYGSQQAIETIQKYLAGGSDG
jgi:hypothetical protein